jgi:hypothetical protein
MKKILRSSSTTKKYKMSQSVLETQACRQGRTNTKCRIKLREIPPPLQKQTNFLKTSLKLITINFLTLEGKFHCYVTLRTSLCCFVSYEGKSISKLQMDIELKQIEY